MSKYAYRVVNISLSTTTDQNSNANSNTVYYKRLITIVDNPAHHSCSKLLCFEDGSTILISKNSRFYNLDFNHRIGSKIALYLNKYPC